jgi:hypothetical protein
MESYGGRSVIVYVPSQLPWPGTNHRKGSIAARGYRNRGARHSLDSQQPRYSSPIGGGAEMELRSIRTVARGYPRAHAAQSNVSNSRGWQKFDG